MKHFVYSFPWLNFMHLRYFIKRFKWK